jgi:AbrB family looped-hinge helix DNA binding protein
MAEVTVLEGYRVTIPKEAREKLRIEKGDKLKLKVQGARIILQSDKIPDNPTMRMLGLAAGHDEPLEKALLEEVEDKLDRQKTR